MKHDNSVVMKTFGCYVVCLAAADMCDCNMNLVDDIMYLITISDNHVLIT